MDHHEDVKLLKALADENRLAILDLLQEGEQCGCLLLEKINITQPTLSHHMKILCDSGIVTSRKEGIWVHYSIAKQKIETIKQIVEKYNV